MRRVLLLHVLLLLLASTDFTIVTAPLGGESLRWSYFKYASQNGFGYKYASQYTLPVILTYLAAFSVGLAGFTLALRKGRPVVGTLGVVLSMLGLISFVVEGSHWALEHNRSWIAFSPVAMFVLTLIALRPQRTAAPTQAGRERQPA